jgi:hypothetical protein
LPNGRFPPAACESRSSRLLTRIRRCSTSNAFDRWRPPRPWDFGRSSADHNAHLFLCWSGRRCAPTGGRHGKSRSRGECHAAVIGCRRPILALPVERQSASMPAGLSCPGRGIAPLPSGVRAEWVIFAGERSFFCCHGS